MLNGCTESRQARRKRERHEHKVKYAEEKLEKNIYIKVKNLLTCVFSEELLKQIANKTRYQQRERKLEPLAVVAILMIGCSSGFSDVQITALERMCLLLDKWFNISVTVQSLQVNINRKESVMFIREIMRLVMKFEIDKVFGKILKKRRLKIRFFERILLQDSTVISLPETLKRLFKGCGGSASEAAVKCDYIIDQNNHLIVSLKCVSGKIPDASLSGDIINVLQENDLVIRDLGYFNLAHFSKIAAKSAYFISRLSKTPYIYLNESDKEPINLIEHLKKKGVESKSVDIDVYVGKIERLHVRLIGVKVPPEVVEARRQQYKTSNGKSKEPSESLIEWNGYTIMVTNIPRTKISLRMILKFYKIRWQIELFFKNIKSVLTIDELTGKNKYRILVLLYTKLTLIWIVGLLYAYGQTLVSNDKELSAIKFNRWLKDVGGLKEALATLDFSKLIQELMLDIDRLCKQKRKRKTTWKDIEVTYENELDIWEIYENELDIEKIA